MKKSLPSSSVFPRAAHIRLQHEGTVWDQQLAQELREIRAEGTVAPDNGQRIGRYEVMGRLGAGAMGQVYRALDPELRREVAIKVHSLHPGPNGSMGELRARLLREGRALACISDPNVVVVYDVGLFRGQVFVAMELVAGSNLRRWIGAQERSVREIVETYLGAASGLAAAHRVGVIHRDVKPANIVVGDDGRVRVLDFGLARAHNAPEEPAQAGVSALNHLTHVGRVMGTPAYIAPEQLAGQDVDDRSDQFSFCVALWEALSGTLPFPAPTLEERASAIEGGIVQGRHKIPSAMREVLLRGLRVDPEKRHRSMEALSDQLRRALARPRRRVLTAMAALAIIGTMLTLAGLRHASSSGSGAAVAPLEARQFESQFQNAVHLYLQDRFDASLLILERLATDSRLPAETALAPEVWGLASEIYSDTGNDKRAEELNELSMDLARRTRNDALLLSGYISKLQLNVATRDFGELRTLVDQARELALRVPVPAMHVEIEWAILMAEIERGDLSQADATTRALLSSPDLKSPDERARVAEAHARLALLENDYATAEAVARAGLVAFAHDGLLHPSVGWSLMASQATALRQLGQSDKANVIFARAFQQIQPEPDPMTAQFLVRFARERLSQGQVDEAKLAVVKLEESQGVAPPLLQELRTLAMAVPR